MYARSILIFFTNVKFIDTTWQNFNPTYPIKTGEPHGLLVGNDLIIFGGFTNAFTIATNRTYARDVTNENSTWRRMDDMPLASGVTHAATVSIGTMVYICGGYYGPHPGPHIPYCFVYDHSKAPGNGQWSNFTNLPNGGTAGAGMIYDSLRNTLYYTGGGQRLTPGSVNPIDVNNTWKFSLNDPASGWLASTPIPYSANHLSYVTNVNAMGQERHFVLAGQHAENECCGNLADHFEFLAANETWIRRASMPFPRGHAAASTRAIGNGFIIAGGSANSNSTKKNRTDDVSYYDIPTDTWTASIGVLPTPGATPIVVVHSNGYMYFVNAAPTSSRRRISA
jgi:Kelch motif